MVWVWGIDGDGFRVRGIFEVSASIGLHGYQQRMAEHVVANPAACLFAEVGLGKTAACLIALERLVESGEAWSVLVVAPKRVAEHVWLQERDKWAPGLGMRLLAGGPKERLRAAMDPAPVHVIGVDNLQHLIDALGDRWPYQMLVIDESHQFKDQGTGRFRKLRKVVGHHERTVLLTATPASESMLGLWSQVYLCDQGKRLGRTFTAYRDAFFQGDYMGWKFSVRPEGEREIYRRISDIAVSLRREDWLELPELVSNVIEVEWDEAERREYERFERDCVMRLADGEVVTAVNAAVLFGKLLQMTGGGLYREDGAVEVVSEAKLDALKELIEGMHGKPLLVFYGFVGERDRILASVKGSAALDVEKWNRGEQKVALAHPASAGAGLNLQHGGSAMCWFSLPPSLEKYTQACGRLHRQGQTERVVIHHLIVPGTIDGDVMQMLRDKQVGQDRLLNALKRRVEK